MKVEDIKKAVSESLDGAVEKLGEKIDEKVTSAVEKSNEETEKRLKALETAPAPKAHTPGVIVRESYKGYRLHEQGLQLREKVAANPARYPTLSDPEKMAEFSKFLIDVKGALCGDIQTQMKLQEARQKADNVEGTDNLGGYLVPDEYQWDLIQLARESSFLLNNATVVPMGSDTLKLPKEASLVTVAWINENAAITASNPTFGQVNLEAKKLAGLTNPISNELLADSAIDIVDMLSNQFAYAIGQELDNQALNGTGDPVSGVLTANAGYSVVMATGLDNFSSITEVNLSEMITNLTDEDAANAKFIYHRQIQHYLRGLKDTAGNHIFQRPTEGRPGMIYEIPYHQSAKAPSSTAASTGFVSLGNWRYFYVGRRRGVMTLDVDPYTNFAKDTVRFRMVTRWAMAVADSNRFVRLVTAA